MAYLANDKYNSALSSGYTVGQTTLSVATPPTNVPTILVVGKGTANETVFACTGKTVSTVTGVTRLRGANVNLDAQTPITCLNNEDFINQYSAAVLSVEDLKSKLYGADGGSTDTYAISLTPAPTSYTNLVGVPIVLKANTVNTGPATLNVNTLGAKTIKKNLNQDLSDGDIQAGQLVIVIYDGTNFQLQAAAPSSEWMSAGETWNFGVADDPTYTVTISGDKTAKYYPGMRVRVSQSTGGTKYFIITKSTYSAPDTTLTLYGGTDYDLANEAISSPSFSSAHAPTGFPMSPAKWTVELIDPSQRLQASPTSTTYYNLGSLLLDIPIGVWDVSYEVSLRSDLGAAGTAQLRAALSTANNSVSDAELKAYALHGNTTGATMMAARRKTLTLANKTRYYLVASVEGSSLSNLIFNGDQATTVVRAICGYL